MPNHDFGGHDITEALKQTFRNRGTDLKNQSENFAPPFRNLKEKQVQWKAFLRKTDLKSENSFKILIEKIQKFLDPPLDSISYQEEFEPSKYFF